MHIERMRRSWITNLLIGATLGVVPALVGACGFSPATMKCEPGMPQPCYTGPPETREVGACRDGLEVCLSDASGFGACVGEVKPVAEDRSTSEDDDCDGQAESFLCEPGTLSSCYAGPGGTDGIGACHTGVRECNVDGDGYGECLNGFAPKAEDCATPEDDDCDGQSNEKEAGCKCAPGSSESCYTGPAGTADIGICATGTKTCNHLGTAYGPCMGQVLPAVEECGTPFKDENCDSTPECGGAHRWSKMFGDAKQQGGLAIAVNGAGDIAVTGKSSGTVDYGLGPLISAGGDDILVAKFDSAGNALWSKLFGDSSFSEWGSSIAVNAVGNVAVAGQFKGIVDLGNGPLISVGGQDVLIAEFDSAGNALWSRHLGTLDTFFYSALVCSVAIDSGGNVVAAGAFGGTLDVGNGPLTSAGGMDLFIAKFDAAGNALWSERFGGVSDDTPRDVAVDSGGNILVAGLHQGTGDFGKGPLASAGGIDILVAKFDANGSPLWSRSLGGVNHDQGWGVAVDDSGSAFVAGEFYGTVDFGAGPLTSAGQSDIFVAKLNAAGDTLWSKSFGDENYQQAWAIAADGAGNVAVTGNFQGTISVVGDPLVSAGNVDVFVLKLDATGTPLWSKRFGDQYYQAIGSVAIDGTGNLLVTGTAYGTVDFGGGPLTSAGGLDIFLAKLAP